MVFTLPMQQVMPYVKLPSNIRASGIEGTILTGKAGEVVIDDFPLRAIEYRYLPSCIPLLKICYRIEYDRGEVQVAYDILHSDTEVSQTRIGYQVAELASRVPDLPAQPTGRLELLIDEMSLLQGKPQVLNGRLLWRDLGLNDSGIKIDIGDFQLDFTGNPDGYDFTLRDLDASLEVDGDGEVEPSGQYSLDIKIAAKSSIDPQVKYVLGIVAKNTGYNQYRIRQSGRLPAHITRQLF
jgi:hypothetical protein